MFTTALSSVDWVRTELQCGSKEEVMHIDHLERMQSEAYWKTELITNKKQAVESDWCDLTFQLMEVPPCLLHSAPQLARISFCGKHCDTLSDWLTLSKALFSVVSLQ